MMRSLSNIVECNVSWRTHSTHSTGIRNFGGFFGYAKCLILNVPARITPPDRIVIAYPTHLDPLVAVSVRGICAIGR